MRRAEGYDGEMTGCWGDEATLVIDSAFVTKALTRGKGDFSHEGVV